MNNRQGDGYFFENETQSNQSHDALHFNTVAHSILCVAVNCPIAFALDLFVPIPSVVKVQVPSYTNSAEMQFTDLVAQ